MVEHRLEFGGLAALRHQDGDIPRTAHPEVAVDCFGKVEEGRRRARRGEGRGDFARDVSRFAEAADDELALAVEDEPNGFLERRVELVRERVERPCLVVKDLATELQYI